MYYVRAYATNSAGTAYGNEVSFTTTAASLATLTTTAASAITTTTAVSGGDITDDNGSNITARGVCWSTNMTPTIAGLHTTDGTGQGVFTSSITGLTPGTVYYVRAYATNSAGTAYGNEVTFTTISGPGANEVWIQGRAFVPSTITITAGTTITWTNKDGINHNVMSDTGVFTSGTIANNGTFSYKFDVAGSFPYHCSIHPDMTATVIVQ
jgi:plastocyanin